MVSILQTQRCKLGLRMLIRVRAVWDTDWTSPDTNDVVAANRLRTEESVVSQVLVGVVLALAVRREAQERQLLIAVLQLQDFIAQVQAALGHEGRKTGWKSNLQKNTYLTCRKWHLCLCWKTWVALTGDFNNPVVLTLLILCQIYREKIKYFRTED